MKILAGGHTAAVADPDHDQVAIVDLDQPALRAVIPLAPADEPGRIVEDSLGRIHVALRRGGAVVSIDPSAGRLLQRRPVCQYPRGIAYRASSDSLTVACAGGELVTMPAGVGPVTSRVRLDDDLRDVVVDGDHLLVSRFRSAEILVVSTTGAIQNRYFVKSIPTAPGSNEGARVAAVAWRMIEAPGGGAFVTLQYNLSGFTTPLPVTVGGYTGGPDVNRCGQALLAPVDSGIARVDAHGTVTAYKWSGPLPVDVAVRFDQPSTFNLVAMVAAGNRNLPGFPRRPWLATYLETRVPETTEGGPPPADCLASAMATDGVGQAIALGFDYAGELVTQSRDPWVISTSRGTVELPGPSRQDTGHYLFHTATPGGIACASCHPEGHDDGFVWTFSDHGPRRTQSLAGGISSTAPFHWEGDMTDLGVLLREVLTKRMGGFDLNKGQAQAVAHFIDGIPAWKTRDDIDQAALRRGQALFESADVGCSGCHSGTRLTNNETMDVGTGAKFQVPSLLGVSRRAPFLHDGRTATLEARLTSGRLDDKHGHLSQLSAAQQTDLLSYLESL